MRRRSQPGALGMALEREEWERASLLLLIALAEALRKAPPGTIDDLLAALAHEEPADDRR